MIVMKYFVMSMLIACGPCLTQAEEAATASPANATPQVRFFPLDAARNGRPSTSATSEKIIRSDSAAMANGYFRVDRSRTITLRGPQIIRPTTTADNDSNTPRIIRGAEPILPPATPQLSLLSAPTTPTNGNPVLSLFGESAGAHSASFRDALTSGKNTQPLANHQWPIPMNNAQRISSNYGFRADPFDKHTEFHSGLDIAASTGTPVLASADGKVASVGTENGYGQSITLLHEDGSESKYSHLSAESVTTGQAVKAGQPIGAVGSTGRSTGPHLDYRLSQDGVSIDPLKALAPKNDAKKIASPRSAAKSERLIVVR